MTLVNDSVDSWDINTYPLVSDRPCREPSLAQRGLNPKPYTPKLKPAGGGVRGRSRVCRREGVKNKTLPRSIPIVICTGTVA
jgi:hypothetical protein